jgi:hypothetical protein
MKIDRAHVRVWSVLMCSFSSSVIIRILIHSAIATRMECPNKSCRRHPKAQRILEVREKHAFVYQDYRVNWTPTRILSLKFCEARPYMVLSKTCIAKVSYTRVLPNKASIKVDLRTLNLKSPSGDVCPHKENELGPRSSTWHLLAVGERCSEGCVLDREKQNNNLAVSTSVVISALT